jgi:myo-inositol-1(or 4)-monophosphatase
MSRVVVPECFRALPEFATTDWSALMDALPVFGDELLERQPDVIARRLTLDDFEFDVERRILALLDRLFPGVGVLAEEHFHRTARPTRPLGRLRLVLDPLDGTQRYASGRDTFTITLAGLVDDVPAFGLVYHPPTGRLYAAARGRGAYRDALPLVPSLAPRTVAMRRGDPSLPQAGRLAEDLARHGYSVEDLECTSLKLCWVGEGTRAGLVKPVTERHGFLSIWGLTAGLLVASESGRQPRAIDGSPWQWAPGPITVGDRAFDATLDELRGTGRHG